MILRIRLPTGATERVTLLPTDQLPQLGAKINALNKLQGQFSLYSDALFTTPFIFETARQGDVIFIQGTAVERPPTSKKEKEETETSKPQTQVQSDAPKFRCRHGPRGMCENCMPREDKRARAEAELKRHGKHGSSISIMEALEALKYKISPQPEAHAKAAAINSEAAHAFQAYLASTGFSQQRVGICYGRADDEGTTNVHAIYEPPQTGGLDAYQMVEGSDAGDISERAGRVAELCDLRCVGMVISARPRNCILSGMDIAFAARLAGTLTEEDRKAFVIFVVTTAETGETLFEAYQISDLAIEMQEAGAFAEVSKQKPNGGKVACTQDVLVEGKDAKKVPTEFFLLNVPIKSCDTSLRTKFTIENRDLTPQGPTELNKIIDDESLSYQKRIADFHLLLFLSNVFDMKSDMPGLCKAVLMDENIGEGYRLMIDNMASS